MKQGGYALSWAGKICWIFLAGFFLFTLALSPAGAAFGKKSDPAPKIKKEEPQKVPQFPHKGIWFNTKKPLSQSAFEDKVTLVYFWDYASINCLREIGTLKLWYQHYHPYGFQMIWVHAPEFPFAAKKENVKQALERLKISYPVILDNDFKLWEAYKVRAWPTKFLVDSEGVIAHTQVGENGFMGTEVRIRQMLQKQNPGVVLPDPVIHNEIEKYSIEQCGDMSSETYAGYKKASWWGAKIANRQWVPENQVLMFKDRGERVGRGFFAQGLWSNREDYFEHARTTDGLTDYLGLIYVAREVYALLKPSDNLGAARIYVTRDESPVPPEYRGVDIKEDAHGATYFLMQEPRLYYLIRNEDEDPHEIKLWTQAAGVAINSFSFSNRCLSEFEHL